MSFYIYEVLNREGEEKKGKIEADSLHEAAGKLKKAGNLILSLKTSSLDKFSFPVFTKKIKFSSLEKIVFTDHLAAMIRSGTPLTEALIAYKERDDGKGSDLVIDGLIKNVEQGRELSEAMSAYPQIFSPLYRALVKASEMSGNLDEVLAYIAGDLRREYEFQQKVKSALMYPVLILIVAFFVIFFLVSTVIPKVTELTKSFGGDLPLATRIISSVSVNVGKYGPFAMIAFIGLIVLFVMSLRNRKMKEKLDPFLLRLPLVGSLIKKYVLARFLRIVGNCVKNGIPLTTSFTTVGEVMDNLVYKMACNRIEEKIVKGVNLAQALSEEGNLLFPKIVVRMIKGAEKTGSVDEAMLRLSDFYENEVDRDLKRLTTMIEPIMIIFLGILVGAIAISVIAPIYQMTSKIK